MPQLTIDKINSWYDEAERIDREMFAEMRSNVLLIAGDHYQKKGSNGVSQRSSTPDSDYQKLRLTKNYVHKVIRHYVAQILSQSPTTTIVPQNDLELQDQKDADLNLAVWRDAKYRYRIREKTRRWCRSFVGVGEVAVKITFDPNRGSFKGHEPMVDVAGNPVVDPMTGQQLVDETKPVFTGEFVFEDIFAPNLLRAPSAKSMSDSPWLMIRKLVDPDVLEEEYGNDPEVKKLLSPSSEDDFIVFEADKGRYNRENKQILVRELYIKPNKKYRNGYFYITTKAGILTKGELPFGVFPIVWAGFDEYDTSARARSIVKVARPFQAELNRASSQLAMAQITLGDDKLLYQQGTKLSPGSLLPGVRGVSYNGTPPIVVPGRDGSQFLPYIAEQRMEMFDAVMLEELNETKDSGQVDAYAMLFRQIRQKLKYAEYAEKFEQFQIDVTETYLKLAQEYLDDDELIAAVGKSETINIAEFRQTTPLRYSIRVEAEDETVEEKFGRQLSINHVLQYVGKQLNKDDIGRLMKHAPFGNLRKAFQNFTIDDDNVENDMLALERGEQPRVSEYDNHEYAAQMLVHRMKQADFQYLAPEVQEGYNNLYSTHRAILEKQAAALAAAKQEMIPSGGALVAADMYVPSEDPMKAPKRVRLPYEALDWLVQKLEEQGKTQDKLETMNQGMLADMATQLAGNPQAAVTQQQQ